MVHPPPGPSSELVTPLSIASSVPETRNGSEVRRANSDSAFPVLASGWWATALMGGLNYQVEHHLFPNMARPDLAHAMVIGYLNRVGLAARDPFECPMNDLRG